jgi:threonine/homoserine/homoserine lactone efflux protein
LRWACEGAFREGIVVEALNPKTAAFLLAFIPGFVDSAHSVPLQFVHSVSLQFVVLGPIAVIA